MGWRKTMKAKPEKTISNPIRNTRNIRNIQENDHPKADIAIIADIAPKNQNVKTDQNQSDSLWQKAWKLSDWIDNSELDIPWQDRAARVPELQRMVDKLDLIEKQMEVTETKKLPPIKPMLRCLHGDPCFFISVKDHQQICVRNNWPIFDLTECPAGLWHHCGRDPDQKGLIPWECNRKTKTPEIGTCPARCKQTGKCYGKTYFTGKPGKVIDCTPDQCPWSDH